MENPFCELRLLRCSYEGKCSPIWTSIYILIRFQYFLIKFLLISLICFIYFCILDPFGPFGTHGPWDLAQLPGLLCLGSAELVLPCSLPCFALPRPPTSLTREAAFGRLHKAPSAPATLCGFPYEACWQHRQGKARQTARQDQLSRAKAKQARQ